MRKETLLYWSLPFVNTPPLMFLFRDYHARNSILILQYIAYPYVISHA